MSVPRLLGIVIVVVILAALLLCILGDFLMQPPRAMRKAQEAQYRSYMKWICAAVEQFRETNDGRVPMLAELLAERDGLLREARDDFESHDFLREERLPFEEAFQIVKLPACCTRGERTCDSYAVTARAPPLDDWGIVFVAGEEVCLPGHEE